MLRGAKQLVRGMLRNFGWMTADVARFPNIQGKYRADRRVDGMRIFWKDSGAGKRPLLTVISALELSSLRTRSTGFTALHGQANRQPEDRWAGERLPVYVGESRRFQKRIGARDAEGLKEAGTIAFWGPEHHATRSGVRRFFREDGSTTTGIAAMWH